MSALNVTGRLCEARFVPPFDVEQAERLTLTISALLSKSSAPVVFCCDMSRVAVFAPEVAEKLVAMMRSDNPRIERNGMLLGESFVFGLQMERMLREAGSPRRKTFRFAEPLTRWLAEVLTSPEQARVKEFLRPSGAP